MKLRFISFTFIILLSVVFNTDAQSKKNSECQSNEISFPCPKDLVLLSKNKVSGLLLFKDSDLKSLGFFVTAKTAVANEKQVIEDAKKELLQKLFPKQSQDYTWKTNKPTFFGEGKPMSKYDFSFGAEKGYNQVQLVFFNFRRIKFKEKDIFVGYIYKDPSKRDAKEGFEGNFGDSLYNSCIKQIRLVYSITGEEISEDMKPCSIMGIAN